MGYSKFKAKRTVIDGISFPSMCEANLYADLKQRERDKQIWELEMQSRVDPEVCQACGVAAAPSVKVDFVFWEHDANGCERRVWAEAKGVETDRWKAFLNWWRHSGPGILRIYNTGRKPGCVRLVEEVNP